MKPGYQPLHAGTKFRLVHLDGTEEWLTSKEYLARKSRIAAENPLCDVPAPGAGPRRVLSPEGRPARRPGY